MLAVINLMNSKIHYLEKFLTLNEEHLERFSSGDLDALDDFYDRREKILENIQYIDARIEQEQRLLPRMLNEFDKKELRELLAIKDQYVEKILDQDLQILGQLDEIKSEIIAELKGLTRNKGKISKFKSPMFSKRLDEVG